jgi:hypothetical protein
MFTRRRAREFLRPASVTVARARVFSAHPARSIASTARDAATHLVL